MVIGMENAEIPHLNERIAALLKGLPPADQKAQRNFSSERRSGYSADPITIQRVAPGLREELRYLPSARKERGPRSVRSLTVLAVAASTGCSRTSWTRIATSIRAFA